MTTSNRFCGKIIRMKRARKIVSYLNADELSVPLLPSTTSGIQGVDRENFIDSVLEKEKGRSKPLTKGQINHSIDDGLRYGYIQPGASEGLIKTTTEGRRLLIPVIGWFFLAADFVKPLGILGALVVGIFGIIGILFGRGIFPSPWGVSNPTPTTQIIYTSSTTTDLASSTINVSGTGNATTFGANSPAIVNNNEYPPPTFKYELVATYLNTPTGTYKKVFALYLAYPVDETLTGNVTTSPSLSCTSNSPLPNQPSWADPFSNENLKNMTNQSLWEVVCTSNAPIIDNGKLFTYEQ
jgi:hypothetical protein